MVIALGAWGDAKPAAAVPSTMWSLLTSACPVRQPRYPPAAPGSPWPRLKPTGVRMRSFVLYVVAVLAFATVALAQDPPPVQPRALPLNNAAAADVPQSLM